MFSPESRYLAAVTRRNVWIIDVRTARTRKLNETPEEITSFAWLGPDEVGYASQVRAEPQSGFYSPHRRFDVAFWRCRAGPAGRPVVIRRLRNVEHLDHARRRGDPSHPQHEWLPGGRVVDKATGKTLLTIPRRKAGKGESG